MTSPRDTRATESGAQDTPASPGAALSPAPDFAAMAIDLTHHIGNGGRIADWLRANWPKPAPAIVRDEAWWWRQAERLGNVIEQWRFEDDLKKTWRSEVAGWLRVTFGHDPAPAPAFDVEGLITETCARTGMYTPMSDFLSTMLAVAKERQR